MQCVIDTVEDLPRRMQCIDTVGACVFAHIFQVSPNAEACSDSASPTDRMQYYCTVYMKSRHVYEEP